MRKRIRFIMDGAAWSMAPEHAFEFAMRQANGNGWNFNLEPFATRLRRDNYHDAHLCKHPRCYHPLRWEKSDWASLARTLQGAGVHPKFILRRGGK